VLLLEITAQIATGNHPTNLHCSAKAIMAANIFPLKKRKAQEIKWQLKS